MLLIKICLCSGMGKDIVCAVLQLISLIPGKTPLFFQVKVSVLKLQAELLHLLTPVTLHAIAELHEASTLPLIFPLINLD